MSAQALVLSGAGKSFRTYRSEWQRTLSWFGVPAKPLAEQWVLRNVSFSLAPGETLGIVGRNGAGKSTLLKLIAGTLRASEGNITTNGRSAALLELGMGFNPEFSGRQNASYAAGLMGFDHQRIQGALLEIEAFADIGDYFDQPIRTYSSGMQMRVAFAVATAFRPDLLMVDEALSVGDVAFQRKSFRRIEQYVEMGTALLYVSHSTETVKRLSERALWIADGAIVMDASSKQVCEAYEKHMLGDHPLIAAPPFRESLAHLDGSLTSNIEVQYGDGRGEITDVTIRGFDGSAANVIGPGEAFSLNYRVRFFDECADVHFGMMIKTVEGVCVYATNTSLTHPHNTHRKHDVVQVKFDLNNNLVPGTYYLNCGTTCADASGRSFLHRRVDVAILRIMTADASAEVGLSNLQAKATVKLLVE